MIITECIPESDFLNSLRTALNVADHPAELGISKECVPIANEILKTLFSLLDTKSKGYIDFIHTLVGLIAATCEELNRQNEIISRQGQQSGRDKRGRKSTKSPNKTVDTPSMRTTDEEKVLEAAFFLYEEVSEAYLPNQIPKNVQEKLLTPFMMLKNMPLSNIENIMSGLIRLLPVDSPALFTAALLDNDAVRATAISVIVNSIKIERGVFIEQIHGQFKGMDIKSIKDALINQSPLARVITVMNDFKPPRWTDKTTKSYLELVVALFIEYFECPKNAEGQWSLDSPNCDSLNQLHITETITLCDTYLMPLLKTCLFHDNEKVQQHGLTVIDTLLEQCNGYNMIGAFIFPSLFHFREKLVNVLRKAKIHLGVAFALTSKFYTYLGDFIQLMMRPIDMSMPWFKVLSESMATYAGLELGNAEEIEIMWAISNKAQAVASGTHDPIILEDILVDFAQITTSELVDLGAKLVRVTMVETLPESEITDDDLQITVDDVVVDETTTQNRVRSWLKSVFMVFGMSRLITADSITQNLRINPLGHSVRDNLYEWKANSWLLAELPSVCQYGEIQFYYTFMIEGILKQLESRILELSSFDGESAMSKMEIQLINQLINHVWAVFPHMCKTPHDAHVYITNEAVGTFMVSSLQEKRGFAQLCLFSGLSNLACYFASVDNSNCFHIRDAEAKARFSGDCKNYLVLILQVYKTIHDECDTNNMIEFESIMNKTMDTIKSLSQAAVHEDLDAFVLNVLESYVMTVYNDINSNIQGTSKPIQVELSFLTCLLKCFKLCVAYITGIDVIKTNLQYWMDIILTTTKVNCSNKEIYKYQIELACCGVDIFSTICRSLGTSDVYTFEILQKVGLLDASNFLSLANNMRDIVQKDSRLQKKMLLNHCSVVSLLLKVTTKLKENGIVDDSWRDVMLMREDCILSNFTPVLMLGYTERNSTVITTCRKAFEDMTTACLNVRGMDNMISFILACLSGSASQELEAITLAISAVYGCTQLVVAFHETLGYEQISRITDLMVINLNLDEHASLYKATLSFFESTTPFIPKEWLSENIIQILIAAVDNQYSKKHTRKIKLIIKKVVKIIEPAELIMRARKECDNNNTVVILLKKAIAERRGDTLRR